MLLQCAPIKILVLAGVLLAASVPVAAQGEPPNAGAQSEQPTGRRRPKMFRDQPFYDPLRAEEHAARIELLIPAWSDEFPHSETSGSRFAWQITLGRELPIVTVSSRQRDGVMGAGEWGIGLWTPVSFHVIEDFADESNPIVDTDYRFGSMVKFQYGLSDRLRLGVRYVPWAHESTHLGDEYVIIAQRAPGFERINVSYEYQSYGISLEGSGALGDDSFVLRHGGIRPFGKDGYYSDHLLGSDASTLTPSTQNFEASFGAEYVLPPMGKRHPYVSFELRHALVYTYHQAAADPERRQWTWNLQIGRTAQPNENKALKDYFVQFHRGVNPYGQLRSQADYWSAGFGWHFGF
jgi:hypothetical protein